VQERKGIMSAIMPMAYAAIASMALVFLRAWQQQNVTGGHYISAIFTSYGIAAADVVVVLSVVKYGMVAIPYIGTGGAVGVTAAMILHRRIFRKRSNSQ
jgi:hypothetical protein